MSEMMKVEAEDPGGLSLETLIPAASTSELEQKQDSKDLIHQMLVIKEEVPHDWSSSLNPEDLHKKEEEEELWIKQEVEQFTVKVEDEEKPQLSELHHLKPEGDRETDAQTSSSAVQIKADPDGGECVGPEPDRNPDPVCPSQE
ncbi:hypothetical protein AMECASPLE_022402, partial [Ameca splendens]